MNDSDVKKLIDLTKNAMTTAWETSQKLLAVEAMLKDRPELATEYQRNLDRVRKADGGLRVAADFEALEKRLGLSN